MAGEEVVWAVPDALQGTVETVLWIIGTVGIFVILYIIFAIINSVLNRKKQKELKRINQNLEDIKLLLGNRRLSPKPRK